MNWDTIRKSCESTPFALIQFPNHRIALFWSKRPGQMGHQVCGALVTDGSKTVFNKTSGCGYSKDEACLEALLRAAKLSFEGHCRDNPLHSMYRYRIGGNYYRIPKKAVRVWR